MVQPNLSFRSSSANPLERKSVEDSFAKSVLWGFAVAGEGIWIHDTNGHTTFANPTMALLLALSLLLTASLSLALNAVQPQPSVVLLFVLAGLMSAITGFHVSSLRAATMAAFLLGGVFFDRPVLALNTVL